jgi:hypothetical protein
MYNANLEKSDEVLGYVLQVLCCESTNEAHALCSRKENKLWKRGLTVSDNTTTTTWPVKSSACDFHSM